jgi:ribosome-associated toxin RatA of RatAB toxin-antitoxin module
MNLRKLTLPVLLLLFISSNSFCQQWNLKVDENGVKIYTRGIENSNFKEFKGEVTVKSNMSGILELIDSVSEYPKWMRNCIESRRLKKVNNSSGYTYYVIKAPWPVSDRDACTYYKVTQDTNTRIVTVTMNSVKDYLPEKPGRVRIPSLKGSWQLIPVSKGVTKIIYQVHCDIGGIVPAVIVNAYITETPFSNLSSIKRIVESPLYPKTVRPDVREL